jgi:hypothetical protein
MPYNTTAIPPRKEVTGQTQLPCRLLIALLRSLILQLTPPLVTRVKKIVAVDPDIAICSNNAAFAITLATVGILTRSCSYCAFTADFGGYRSYSSSTWLNKHKMRSSWSASRGAISSTKI